MHHKVVLIAPCELLFTADDFGEVSKFSGITASSFKLYGLGAINPPLNLKTGLRVLDNLFRAPAGEEKLEVIKESALVKLLASQNRAPEQGTLPFNDQEASFLIGLSYRLTLTQTIMASLDITPSSEAHKKVGALGWEDYYSKIIIPALAARKINSETLNRSNNLRTREPGLTAAKNLKLVLTGNDFLLTQEDLAWFRKRFPDDRTIYTETGGHMGQLWKPEVQESIRAAIRWDHPDSSSK